MIKRQMNAYTVYDYQEQAFHVNGLWCGRHTKADLVYLHPIWNVLPLEESGTLKSYETDE